MPRKGRAGPKMKAFTPEQEEAIWEWHRQGRSADDISRNMHVSRDRVDRILAGDRRAELQEAARREKVANAALNNWGITRMIRELGMSKVVIERHLAEIGYTPPRGLQGRSRIRTVTLVKMLSSGEWRYVAGAFDASGQVMTRATTTKVHYFLEFRGRTAMVEHLRDLFGTGSLRTSRNSNSSTLRIMAHADVITVGEGILPYTTIPNIVERVIRMAKRAMGIDDDDEGDDE